jgi:hypothetical protein
MSADKTYQQGGVQLRQDGSLHVPTGKSIDYEAGAKQSYGDVVGHVQSIQETVLFSQFTDGGSTAGTYQMAGTVPAGAILLGSKALVNAGFAGDTSATLTIGDGSDVDRYNTGTPSVFATAATGVETGIPSGSKLVTTANRPTLTVTSGADFTSVNAGSLTLTIYYLATV